MEEIDEYQRCPDVREPVTVVSPSLLARGPHRLRSLVLVTQAGEAWHLATPLRPAEPGSHTPTPLRRRDWHQGLQASKLL